MYCNNFVYVNNFNIKFLISVRASQFSRITNKRAIFGQLSILSKDFISFPRLRVNLNVIIISTCDDYREKKRRRRYLTDTHFVLQQVKMANISRAITYERNAVNT